MFKKSNKQEIVTSIFIFLWILAINVVTPLITKAPSWPMFFVTIFFFVQNADIKKLPSLFLSGLIGIIFAFVLIKLLGVLAPVMGESGATVLLIGIVLAIIIIGGNWAPGLFNNITFGYLTICAIDMTIIETSFVSWLVMFVVGGAVIVGGAIGLSILAGKLFNRK